MNILTLRALKQILRNSEDYLKDKKQRWIARKKWVTEESLDIEKEGMLDQNFISILLTL